MPPRSRKSPAEIAAEQAGSRGDLPPVEQSEQAATVPQVEAEQQVEPVFDLAEPSQEVLEAALDAVADTVYDPALTRRHGDGSPVEHPTPAEPPATVIEPEPQATGQAAPIVRDRAHPEAQEVSATTYEEPEHAGPQELRYDDLPPELQATVTQRRLGALASFLQAQFPENPPALTPQGTEDPISHAMRLLVLLKTPTHQPRATCDQPYCNKSAGHDDLHGWVN